MKTNILCWLIGHDFRTINIMDNEFGQRLRNVKPSNFCRRCGLLKEDVFR